MKRIIFWLVGLFMTFVGICYLAILGPHNLLTLFAIFLTVSLLIVFSAICFFWRN